MSLKSLSYKNISIVTVQLSGVGDNLAGSETGSDQKQDRIRNGIGSETGSDPKQDPIRTRIRSRIRNKSFRIHNPASNTTNKYLENIS
jgi:hypothetical protein